MIKYKVENVTLCYKIVQVPYKNDEIYDNLLSCIIINIKLSLINIKFHNNIIIKTKFN